ncbi:hypothetical protein EFK50_01025 [Nocardioides marmoriginsengisoli]|uniref:Uncharacterized protein n=1 Tax=Nocardioides marmoriginsengisoli TaxID=661483 RepID=A0A3N0CS97_9ACTN|nr:hypothetical protein [Nocardioides marmoriginsengisoli]RNL66239.1 hypothetical protein EFK50_01025 [Nocardioides marmoriginsengisoli]
MNEAAAKRRYEALHKERPFHNGDFRNWSAEATPATPFHYLDGVDISVAEVDLNPTDDFLNARRVFGNHDSSDGEGGDPNGDSS